MESQTSKADHGRTRPDVEREYRNNEIVVFWEPRLCIHAGFCFRGLPAVFKPNDRPWVILDGAEADEVAQVVMTCPTGALHFERLDGGPQEQPDDETTIKLQVNGPLYLRGKLRVVGPGNHKIREDTRLALCRCGVSANKPFCDGSHARIGFDSSK
jgi:uncharacterized Fe-S cluster protein YjdI/CDGSH-type Zn-finger protein